MDIGEKFKDYDIIPGAQQILKILLRHINHDEFSGSKVDKNTLAQEARVASNAVVRNYISRIRRFVGENNVGYIVTITNPISEHAEYQFRFTEDQKDNVIRLQNFLGIRLLEDQLREGDEVTLTVPGISRSGGTIIGKDDSRWVVDIDNPIHVSSSYLKPAERNGI